MITYIILKYWYDKKSVEFSSYTVVYHNGITMESGIFKGNCAKNLAHTLSEYHKFYNCEHVTDNRFFSDNQLNVKTIQVARKRDLL